MCRIGTNDEDLWTSQCHLNADTATGSGFSNASFATDENPVEGFLFDDVAKGWFGEVVKIFVGHVSGGFVWFGIMEVLLKLYIRYICIWICVYGYGYVYG